MYPRRLAPLAGALGVVLLLAGCATPRQSPSGQTPSTHAVGHPGLNEEAPDKSRVWTGQAPSDVAYAAEVLSALSSENEDITAGVSLTSDATMVEMYLTARGDSLRGAMRESLGEGFERIVRIVPVEYSTDDLRAAQEAIGDDLWDALGIVSLGADIENNALAIDVTPESWAEIADNVDVIVLDGSRQNQSLRVRSLGLNIVDVGVPMLVREGAEGVVASM